MNRNPYQKADLEALRSPLFEPIVIQNRAAYALSGLRDGVYSVRHVCFANA